MNVVNLERAFAKFSEHWSPKIAAEFNGQRLKLAKLKGEFIWHEHTNEDELFLVVRGRLRIRLEQGEVVLREGDLTVIPRGTRHLPIGDALGAHPHAVAGPEIADADAVRGRLELGVLARDAAIVEPQPRRALAADRDRRRQADLVARLERFRGDDAQDEGAD